MINNLKYYLSYINIIDGVIVYYIASYNLYNSWVCEITYITYKTQEDKRVLNIFLVFKSG